MQFRTGTALAVIGALLIGASSAAAAKAPPAAVIVPILSAVRDTNTNDLHRLDSYYVAAPVIVDEFPPFVWTGAQAATRWWMGFEKLGKNAGLSNVKAMTLPVRESDTTQDKAYVVVPMEITYVYKAKPQKETGVLTCTLQRTGKTWKIATQTWSTASNTMQ